MQNTRKIALLGVALLLSGCATQQLHKGLESLMGQNIHAAINRLGYPDGQRTVLGDTIYIWSSSHDTALPLTTTNTTSGMVGTTPVYGQQTNMQWVPLNFNCTIQIATDSSGTIIHYEFSGNEGGCQQYANRF